MNDIFEEVADYRDLEQRLFKYTNAWTRESGEFPLKAKSERENADAILSKHYYNVDDHHLDYDDIHVDGTNYKIIFSDPKEVEEDDIEESKKRRADEIKILPNYDVTKGPIANGGLGDAPIVAAESLEENVMEEKSSVFNTLVEGYTLTEEDVRGEEVISISTIREYILNYLKDCSYVNVEDGDVIKIFIEDVVIKEFAPTVRKEDLNYTLCLDGYNITFTQYTEEGGDYNNETNDYENIEVIEVKCDLSNDDFITFKFYPFGNKTENDHELTSLKGDYLIYFSDDYLFQTLRGIELDYGDSNLENNDIETIESLSESKLNEWEDNGYKQHVWVVIDENDRDKIIDLLGEPEGEGDFNDEDYNGNYVLDYYFDDLDSAREFADKIPGDVEWGEEETDESLDESLDELYLTVSLGGDELNTIEKKYFNSEEAAREHALKDNWNTDYRLYKRSSVINDDGSIDNKEEFLGNIPSGRDRTNESLDEDLKIKYKNKNYNVIKINSINDFYYEEYGRLKNDFDSRILDRRAVCNLFGDDSNCDGLSNTNYYASMMDRYDHYQDWRAKEPIIDEDEFKEYSRDYKRAINSNKKLFNELKNKLGLPFYILYRVDDGWDNHSTNYDTILVGQSDIKKIRDDHRAAVLKQLDDEDNYYNESFGWPEDPDDEVKDIDDFNPKLKAREYIKTNFGDDYKIDLHGDDLIGDRDTGDRQYEPGINWDWFFTDNEEDAHRWFIQLTGSDEDYLGQHIIEPSDRENRWSFALHHSIEDKVKEYDDRNLDVDEAVLGSLDTQKEKDAAKRAFDRQVKKEVDAKSHVDYKKHPSKFDIKADK